MLWETHSICKKSLSMPHCVTGKRNSRNSGLTPRLRLMSFSFLPGDFGKTSLVKRVQSRLAAKGAVVIFADFFGVGSVEDVAARLAKAVYGFTHGKPSLWKTALRTLLSFRPVLKPDPSGGISLSVEPATAGRSGLHLLEETIDSLYRFTRTPSDLYK